MTETISSPEIKRTYGAIVIPSYGMTKDDRGYHLTFFSGIVCKAAYELWKERVAPKIIIEGARIFPGDTKNDGDLMHDLLLKLGIPEDVVIQRRDNSNTYNQLLDVKKTLIDSDINGKVLTVFADLHKRRIPQLLENYKINSDTKIAEEALSERYPDFEKAWQEIKSDPSYEEKMERIEKILAKELRVDPKGNLGRLASWASFRFKGADVPDVRHRKSVRFFATSNKEH